MNRRKRTYAKMQQKLSLAVLYKSDQFQKISPHAASPEITSHSMKNLAVHSLLRWKDDYTTNSHYLTYKYIFLGRLGECTFLTLWHRTAAGRPLHLRRWRRRTNEFATADTISRQFHDKIDKKYAMLRPIMFCRSSAFQRRWLLSRQGWGQGTSGVDRKLPRRYDRGCDPKMRRSSCSQRWVTAGGGLIKMEGGGGGGGCMSSALAYLQLLPSFFPRSARDWRGKFVDKLLSSLSRTGGKCRGITHFLWKLNMWLTNISMEL